MYQSVSEGEGGGLLAREHAFAVWGDLLEPAGLQRCSALTIEQAELNQAAGLVRRS